LSGGDFAMMGRLKGDQSQLFYEFCLDDVVPDDHLVRGIPAVLDLSWVHAELARLQGEMLPEGTGAQDLAQHL
jgi:hypothetical protein